uniref:Dual specificity phosphatase 8 n=1 Tax=Buteo japonicus TaxID=224669 RepID=A0A8B9Z328_9AVES
MAGDRLPRKVMDPKKLASLLRNGAEGTLVIDSRSFVEYNSWHVLSSVNICCSKLVKRRLQQDKVSITELIQPASKMKVGDLHQDVVVYDQSTRDVTGLAADSFLSILLGKLDSCFHSVSILTGRRDLMTQNGISYVLNASNSCPKPDFICDSHFMRIPVNDNYCEKLLPWLDKSIEFIDKAKVSSCQVIVHCLAGISRSATIAIAYIMKTMGMSSDDAYRDQAPTGAFSGTRRLALRSSSSGGAARWSSRRPCPRAGPGKSWAKSANSPAFRAAWRSSRSRKLFWKLLPLLHPLVSDYPHPHPGHHSHPRHHPIPAIVPILAVIPSQPCPSPLPWAAHPHWRG